MFIGWKYTISIKESALLSEILVWKHFSNSIWLKVILVFIRSTARALSCKNNLRVLCFFYFIFNLLLNSVQDLVKPIDYKAHVQLSWNRRSRAVHQTGAHDDKNSNAIRCKCYCKPTVQKFKLILYHILKIFKIEFGSVGKASQCIILIS